jgi:hypothetical protein
LGAVAAFQHAPERNREMRITASSTTPPASERDKARFRVLVEPENRTRMFEDGVERTVGDVLDSPPVDCRFRRRWYSPGKERGGIRELEPCGQRACPTCVVTWLVDRVAAPWAYWDGRADVLEFASDSRKHRRFRVRGDDATPGVLSLSDDTGATLLVPGDELRGSALDRELVARLRALPLDVDSDRVKRTPSDSFGTVPRSVTPDEVRTAAMAAGFHVWSTKGGRWHYDATEEQNHVFVAELWEARRTMPLPLDVRMPLPLDVRGSGDGPGVPLPLDVPGSRTERTLSTLSTTSTPHRQVTDEQVTDVSLNGDRPHCRLCDDTRWHGFLHDREFFGGLYGPLMTKAHYPYGCGVGVGYEEELGYRYPAGYLNPERFIKRGVHDVTEG